MYWEKADGGYGNATLDANTGKELQLSAIMPETKAISIINAARHTTNRPTIIGMPKSW
jgi:hypothetical protein